MCNTNKERSFPISPHRARLPSNLSPSHGIPPEPAPAPQHFQSHRMKKTLPTSRKTTIKILLQDEPQLISIESVITKKKRILKRKNQKKENRKKEQKKRNRKNGT